MVRQIDIAREAGLDVSSVNKILNGRVGPVFKRETILRVKAIARRSGYKVQCAGCRRRRDRSVKFYALPKGKVICATCAGSVIAQVSNEVSAPPIPIEPCGPLDAARGRS